jgi:two-component system, OmpR family, sensor kinase
MTKNSRQSFRLLLTRQYAISFLLLLLILGGVTYFSLYQCLLQNLDHGILLIAQSEADFATRNAALHLHRTRNVLPGVQSQYLSRYVEILTISGNLVVSNHFSKISLLPPIQKGNDNEPAFRFAKLNNGRYRIISFPIEKDGQSYILQVATPMQSIENTLGYVMTVYSFSCVFVLLFALWLAWRLARRAVAPLDIITAISDRISVQELDQRIPIAPDMPIELYDLTQKLNHMFERLDLSTQTLRQFTADASHELKTPLTILKGEIQVALRKPRDAKAYQSLVESNLEEVERLILLVDALLQLSRFDQSRSAASLIYGVTEYNTVIRQCLPRWKTLAQEKRVQIIFDSPDTELWVNVAPAYIIQLLHNLFENALRASRPCSEIKVALLDMSQNVILSITDWGLGIDELYHQRIFERFFQVDASRSENTNHFGIGLSLCKAIVESHGGTLALKSKVGKGSTFSITFQKALLQA